MNKLPESTLVKDQKITKTFERTNDQGERVKLKVQLRYDDQCGNGHNTFAITADMAEWVSGSTLPSGSCGCLHDEIEKYAPEFASYIKWHLVDSDGPMHYVANTCFLAGNKDYNGRSAGEPYAYEPEFYFGDSPIAYNTRSSALTKMMIDIVACASVDEKRLGIVSIPHGPDTYDYDDKYSFEELDTAAWYLAPFNTRKEAEQLRAALHTCQLYCEKVATQWGNGKEREFEAARHAAVWPEATVEQLSLPREELAALLEARLPALMQDFKANMETLGFTY